MRFLNHFDCTDTGCGYKTRVYINSVLLGSLIVILALALPAAATLDHEGIREGYGNNATLHNCDNVDEIVSEYPENKEKIKMVGGGSIRSYIPHGERQNFNQEVSDNDGHPIHCANLAAAFVMGAYDYNGQFDFTNINTEDKLRSYSRIPTCNEYMKKFTHMIPSYGYYFNVKNFSFTLIEIIKKQLRDNCFSKKYFIYSENHAMGIAILVNPDGNEIKLAFYEPNDTIRVHWFVISSLEAVSSLSLQDLFLKQEQFEEIFERGLSHGEEGVGCFASLERTDKLENCHVVLNGLISPSMFFLLMFNGHFGHQTIRAQVNDNKNSGLSLRLEDLSMKSIDGFLGVFALIQNKHDESLAYFSELLFSGDFTSSEQAWLLAGGRSTGSELYANVLKKLNFGNVKCVNILVKAFNKFSEPDNKYIKQLLAGRNYHDVPCFFYPMSFGNIELVKIYMMAVLDSQLCCADKVELITIKRESSESGIFSALSKGYDECVEVYITKVLNSKLDQDAIYQMLMITDQQGRSLFSQILKKRKLLLINLFITEARQNLQCDESFIVDVLTEKGSLDSSACLFYALDCDNPEDFRCFMQAILSSKLNTTHKKLLLTISKSGDHTCILSEEQKKIYLDVMRNSMLAPDEKEALIDDIDAILVSEIEQAVALP